MTLVVGAEGALSTALAPPYGGEKCALEQISAWRFEASIPAGNTATFKLRLAGD